MKSPKSLLSSLRDLLPYLAIGIVVFLIGASLAGAILSRGFWIPLTCAALLTVWLSVISFDFSATGASTSKEAQILGEKREAIEKLSQEQSTPKLAWDLARITLEQYFNRNLGQTRLMFYLALIVMFAGFGLVVWTIMYSIAHAQDGSKALIGVGAGVITQFIGATFMVLYRSTIQQASSYVEILERINAVGMAVQIIQDVPKDDPLHNKTRAEIAYLLLRGSHKTSEDRRVRPRSKKTRTYEDA